MRLMLLRSMLLATLIAVCLGACAGPAVTPASPPTVPTASIPPTEAPTSTPIPTNTPTETPTSTPTATSTPSSTPTPTNTPTPTPTDTPIPTETPRPPTNTPRPPTQTPTPTPANEWNGIPLFPGAANRADKNGEHEYTVPNGVNEIFTYYQTELSKRGYAPYISMRRADGSSAVVMMAKANVMVTVGINREGDQTKVTISVETK